MSELDDIAAAAGIVIVDTAPGDGGDADKKTGDGGLDLNGSNPPQAVVSAGSGDTGTIPEVSAMEAMFSNRYTMDDPDYAEVVNDSEFTSQSPCVKDFSVRRPRDDSRHRGGRRGHHHGNRHYQDRGDNRSRHHRDGGDWRDRSREGHRHY